MSKKLHWLAKNTKVSVNSVSRKADGQSNWTEGCIVAAAHGQFRCIHQVAPMFAASTVVHHSRHLHHTTAAPAELLGVCQPLDMSWVGPFLPSNSVHKLHVFAVFKTLCRVLIEKC